MKTVIAIIFLILPYSALAEGTEGYDYSAFVGIGPGFAFPGPIRLRFHNVEVGTYGIGLGVTRSFRQEHIYAQFGGGLSAYGQTSPGLIAAVGTEYIFFWIIGIRGEFFTFYGLNAMAYSGATIGLSVSL